MCMSFNNLKKRLLKKGTVGSGFGQKGILNRKIAAGGAVRGQHTTIAEVSTNKFYIL